MSSPAPAAPSSTTGSSTGGISGILRVAPAVIRSFEAGPDGLDLICIGGRKPKGGDTERFQTSGRDARGSMSLGADDGR